MALHGIALHCIALHCIALHCIATCMLGARERSLRRVARRNQRDAAGGRACSVRQGRPARLREPDVLEHGHCSGAADLPLPGWARSGRHRLDEQVRALPRAVLIAEQCALLVTYCNTIRTSMQLAPHTYVAQHHYEFMISNSRSDKLTTCGLTTHRVSDLRESLSVRSHGCTSVEHVQVKRCITHPARLHFVSLFTQHVRGAARFTHDYNFFRCG
jgi:hypothetical protein